MFRTSASGLGEPQRLSNAVEVMGCRLRFGVGRLMLSHCASGARWSLVGAFGRNLSATKSGLGGAGFCHKVIKSGLVGAFGRGPDFVIRYKIWGCLGEGRREL